MRDEEKQIAHRYRGAQMRWDHLMMRNVANITAEQQVKLDLEVERARQELSEAEQLYREMISDRVKKERLN
jgi:hypothetical protein